MDLMAWLLQVMPPPYRASSPRPPALNGGALILSYEGRAVGEGGFGNTYRVKHQSNGKAMWMAKSAWNLAKLIANGDAIKKKNACIVFQQHCGCPTFTNT